MLISFIRLASQFGGKDDACLDIPICDALHMPFRAWRDSIDCSVSGYHLLTVATEYGGQKILQNGLGKTSMLPSPALC